MIYRLYLSRQWRLIQWGGPVRTYTLWPRWKVEPRNNW
jgi:hypothetical protein